MDSSESFQRDIPQPVTVRMKIEVLKKNKDLCYRETVWTKVRLDRLRAIGFTDSLTKATAVSEDSRWPFILHDIIIKPWLVTPFWSFLCREFATLSDVLESELKRRLTRHFHPVLRDLPISKVHETKVCTTLTDMSEQFDKEMTRLSDSLAEQQIQLQAADNAAAHGWLTLRNVDPTIAEPPSEWNDTSIEEHVSLIAQSAVTAIRLKSVEVTALRDELAALKGRSEELEAELAELKNRPRGHRETQTSRAERAEKLSQTSVGGKTPRNTVKPRAFPMNRATPRKNVKKEY